MKEHLPALAVVASLLLAAWLYLRPPGPPPPTASAPVAYVRQLSPDEPLAWMDEYWAEQRAKREAAWRKRQDGLAKLKHPGCIDPFVSDGRIFWPHLGAEGNTSDI